MQRLLITFIFSLIHPACSAVYEPAVSCAPMVLEPSCAPVPPTENLVWRDEAVPPGADVTYHVRLEADPGFFIASGLVNKVESRAGRSELWHIAVWPSIYLDDAAWEDWMHCQTLMGDEAYLEGEIRVRSGTPAGFMAAASLRDIARAEDLAYAWNSDYFSGVGGLCEGPGPLSVRVIRYDGATCAEVDATLIRDAAYEGGVHAASCYYHIDETPCPAGFAADASGACLRT